jgi:hypothetical protein
MTGQVPTVPLALPDMNGSETVVEEPPAAQSRRVPLAEQLARNIEPVDWAALWMDEHPEAEWLVEPIVPRGRQVAIYSPAKLGKSLLMLDVVAAMATGRSVLGQPAVAPVSVMYLDLEMTEQDLRDRLTDLGYGPEDDLSRLVYFQLPSLPDLDTDRGGQVLDALVAIYEPALVVIDTMARVVEGPEDDADTYRNFYKHTGTRLKQRGVSLARLDHAGKDLTRGQRGSSSKADDVDLVWQLNVIDDNVVLRRTHSRLSWVPAEVVLRRETEPNLRHVQTDGAWPAGTKEVADLLDEFDVPVDASVSMAMRTLKQANRGRRKTVVMAGLKWRRVRS